MMAALKRLIRRNKILYDTLKKVQVALVLSKVYFLKIFDFSRKDRCAKDTIRCEYDIRNKHYKYTLLGQDTPVCCMTHLYEILRDVSHVLNEGDVEYFIMYGTLLGQVRHGESFIPWDTDVDIVVMREDKGKAIDLLQTSMGSVYDMVEDTNILKINYSETNKLHADIYFWEEEDGVLIDNFNDYWVKNRVKSEDVFPLKMSKIYDIDIKVPKDSERVLRETYGIDCLEVAYKKYAFRQETTDQFLGGRINMDDLRQI